MEAVIVMPCLPPRECSPNWRGHWGTRRRAVEGFRSCARWATHGALRESGARWRSDAPVVMDVDVAWCCGRQRIDDDNLIAALKPARDGIADILFDGEDRCIVMGTVTQRRGDGTVTVTLRTRDAPESCPVERITGPERHETGRGH